MPRRNSGEDSVRPKLTLHGVDRVLVTCDQDNAGSRAVIESCGGVLDSVVTVNGKQPVLRFWID
jgi:predicted acetyltransferase